MNIVLKKQKSIFLMLFSIVKEFLQVQKEKYFEKYLYLFVNFALKFSSHKDESKAR